jgi:hypothetical protein
MWRKLLMAALAAACVGGVALPEAASAGTLDQQQTNGSGSTFNVDNMQNVAQTFTAGLTGGLDQVDLKLAAASAGTPTLPLTVEIRNVTGGFPGSSVLGGGSLPVSALPPTGSPAFVPLVLNHPVSVQAGTAYAIVATNADIYPKNWGWAEDPTNPYPSGAAVFENTSLPTPTWMNATGSDMAFKTYVGPPVATGQRAAALKKCKKKRTKAKRRRCRTKARKLPV